MAAAASSSAATSSSSGGSGSNSTAGATESTAWPCPICLGAFEDEAYLDVCFHSFCYKCICRWVKIVASKHAEPLSSVRCPLCKTKNSSIIHDFDGESFRRHYVKQDSSERSMSLCAWLHSAVDIFLFSAFTPLVVNDFFLLISLFLWYRHLIDAHELISQFYNTREVSDSTSNMHQYWKQRKYLRKNIWLKTWLRQEIQALTLDENVEVIVSHIHGVIEYFMKEHAPKKIAPDKKSEEFKSQLSDAARPFLLDRAARFAAEVELFLVSHLNIDAYSRVRVRRFTESASHVTGGQDVLPHDRPLEDHYLYFISNEMDCTGGEI